MCFLPWVPLIDKYCVGCLQLQLQSAAITKAHVLKTAVTLKFHMAPVKMGYLFV